MTRIVVLCLSLILISSCKKAGSEYVNGTVKAKFGCLPDSWVVRLDKPDPMIHHFLCNVPSGASDPRDYCGNAVIISLPPSLAIVGKRIKFNPRSVEPSCLSYSEAPNMLSVTAVLGMD